MMNLNREFAASALPHWTALFKNRPASTSPHFDTAAPSRAEMFSALQLDATEFLLLHPFISDEDAMQMLTTHRDGLANTFLEDAFKEPA